MKRFKNGKLIWIIGAVGLIAVIGVVLYSHLAYLAPPRGYTPQEIDAMGIEPVNINTASAEELNELSGVSEKQAQSIVAYREEHGAFTSAEEIMQVEGVGKKTYERIAPYITVSLICDQSFSCVYNIIIVSRSDNVLTFGVPLVILII